MARHNLKLDYSELEKLSTSCLNLSSSLEEIRNAVKGMETTIASCEGQAVTAITGDGDEIVEIIDKLSNGLNLFGTETNNFCGDMRAIINSQGGGMLHVNSWRSNYNLGQMISDLINFNSYAQGSRHTVSYATNNLSTSLLPEEDVAAISQVNAQLENVVDIMKAGASELLKYEDDFQKFKQKIKDFENKDDDYRNSLQNIYYEVVDAKWYEKTCGKIVIAVVVIGVAAAIIFFAPAIAALAATGGVVGTIAAALSSATAVSIATDIVTVGIATGVLSGAVSIFTGEDVEDSFGAGLMDGIISGAITSGAGAIAKCSKLGMMGTKLSETASSYGIMLRGETARALLAEGVESTGVFTAEVAKCLYNGNDVNVANIAATTAFDRGLDKGFKEAGKYVSKKYFDSDINVFQNGEFSFNDAKKALKKFFADRSIDSAKEISGQIGHEAIDNTLAEDKSIQDVQVSDVELEKIPEKFAKDGLKKGIKTGVDDIADIISDSFF